LLPWRSLTWMVRQVDVSYPARPRQIARSVPWGEPDERRNDRGAEPGDGAAPHEAERCHRRGLAAGQRDQLALFADAGRAVAAPGRRDARGPRLLDRRGAAHRREQAADPDPEYRHD